MARTKTIVIALGGNAILQRGQRGTFEEQHENVRRTCEQLAEIVRLGHRLIVTHGNGPQVGDILIQQECATDAVPPMPLDVCGAQTQGMIGYMIQRSLRTALEKRDIHRSVVTVVTQVVVARNDPAFEYPTKPVGPFFSEEKARREMAEKGQKWIEEPGRGWRRVVPSPEPINIVEKEAIKTLVASGNIVIACGGGGIPVIETEGGNLRGVEAVIDKDLAAQKLAIDVEADIMLILTDVRKVALNFHKPQQTEIDRMTISQAKQHAEEGHFAVGSMLPKVTAAIRFLEAGGETALIANLGEAVAALQDKAGTRIVNDRAGIRVTGSAGRPPRQRLAKVI